MYLRYGIPRAIRGLRTNWRANINNVLILAASLGVLGMIVLLYLNIVHFSEAWLSDTTISLFLEPDLDPAARRALFGQVQHHPLVKAAVMVTPQDGLRELAEKLGADHAMLLGAGTEGLPYTIDVTVFLNYRDRIDLLANRFEALTGVADVIYTQRLLEEVKLFFVLLKGIGWFFITLMVLSFFLIVSHATKLSLYARRDEIGILSLVGATRNFICSSFVVEGILIALAGCLLAAGIVWMCYQLLISGFSWNEITLAIKAQTVFFPLPALGAALGAAALLGAMSSHFAVTRLLKELEP